MRRLAENAGVDGEVVIENVRRDQAERKSNLGYNVMTGEYIDMLAAGILDPGQGDAVGRRERRLDRCHGPDHRGDDHGQAGAQVGHAADAARWRRDGLLARGTETPKSPVNRPGSFPLHGVRRRLVPERAGAIKWR